MSGCKPPAIPIDLSALSIRGAAVSRRAASISSIEPVGSTFGRRGSNCCGRPLSFSSPGASAPCIRTRAPPGAGETEIVVAVSAGWDRSAPSAPSGPVVVASNRRTPAADTYASSTRSAGSPAAAAPYAGAPANDGAEPVATSIAERTLASWPSTR
jgi:hypothetical protein